jgi:hypothetical protein
VGGEGNMRPERQRVGWRVSDVVRGAQAHESGTVVSEGTRREPGGLRAVGAW